MMLFLVNKAAWNQQRKRHILMAGSLKPPVEGLLHILPKRPAIGPDNHAAAHWCVVRKLRLQHQLVVPLREILCASREFFVGHAFLCPVLSVAIPCAT